MEIRSELLGIEEEFWQSAGDRDRYEANLAADAIHVFPGWGVAARESVLEGVAQADSWESFTIGDPDVVELSNDTAALVYRARAQRADEPPYDAAITSVYRRRNGHWELVLHQQTLLSGD
jgi:hypothetical protein